ncbi:MAG TPA: energy transducer TonB, partial [Vicinamibacterales bacterium]
YDEALAALNTLQPAESGDAISDRKSIEEYRSFCLLALGRDNEAETAIAAVITADPSYQPSETEASPRVRSAFSQVRQRLLPDIATARYQAAKAVFDHKDYGAAVKQFHDVLALLDDPDMGGRLPDIKTLAGGFLDLAATASTPPPAPKPAAVAPPPAPVVPKPDPNRVYSTDDAGVTPPVIVRQDLPRFDPTLLSQAHDHGVLDVVIDEHGRVISLNVREPIQPRYDADLITTARAWRFQPATMNGQPVKFRKLIQINVARQ